MSTNKNKKAKIKIIITYKFPHILLKSNILTPIQSGRAMTDDKFKHMIGDDTGDNISSQNNIYSELSALYWVWKNYEQLGNPDYIGHMHYRRQFLFDTKDLQLKKWWISTFYFFDCITKKVRNAFSDKKIEEVVPQYDYLIPGWHDVKSKRVPPLDNVRQEYVETIPGARADIWDKFIKICYEKHPDYAEEIEKIDKGTKVLVCNMFIMRKELFFKYCEFAFPVLFELVKQVDPTGLTVNGQRFAGYMAEKLQSMFIMRLEKDPSLKEKILTCSYIRYPEERNPKYWIKWIFSVENEMDNYKIITFFGFKIKLYRQKKVIKKATENIRALVGHISRIDKRMGKIESKEKELYEMISCLQEQVASLQEKVKEQGKEEK